MEQFTALIVYLALFFIVPYVTTIVYLRWQRIHIRFAKQASVGMEMACFLPMIVATHVVAVLTIPFVDRVLLSIGRNLHGEVWSGVFFGHSYTDTLSFLFSTRKPETLDGFAPWLGLFLLVLVVHLLATKLLAWEIDRELNWAMARQSIKDTPNAALLNSDKKGSNDSTPAFGLIALEWLRAFGIWNELSQDLSFRDSYESKEIRLDVCLDGAGEVIYQGILEAYSDSGGFTGIVMREVQVNRNAFFSENQGSSNTEVTHFKMLRQYPYNPPHSDQRKLDRLFIAMSDIKTLHRRFEEADGVIDDQPKTVDGSGEKAFNIVGHEADRLSKRLNRVFGINFEKQSRDKSKSETH